MKNFIITSLLTIAIVGTVVSFWRWNASRLTDDVGTKAMLEEKERLEDMAKKYSYKGDE